LDLDVAVRDFAGRGVSKLDRAIDSGVETSWVPDVTHRADAGVDQGDACIADVGAHIDLLAGGHGRGGLPHPGELADSGRRRCQPTSRHRQIR
jgi:hypothetical protein